MNFGQINKAIVESVDIPGIVKKDRYFYEYLLINNVAYYYCKNISKTQNRYELSLLNKGKELNEKYVRTLTLIRKVCEENNIIFALFKTFKHVEEAVDGDVDIVVKEKDYHRFLRVLEENDFVCKEDAQLKACCEKEGYLKIEPRVNISFHNKQIFDQETIWNNIDQISIADMAINTTTQRFDALCLLLNVLYGPKYVGLYLNLLLKDFEPEDLLQNIQDEDLKSDIMFSYNNLLGASDLEKKHPLFLSNIVFFLWWFRRIFFDNSYKFSDKLRHLLFFYYCKYKYFIFNSLHFQHKWEMKKI